ncbi:MAG TPA: hypothetical protein VFP34_05420 [Microlunatus sp.]|nr:hypothetical protein [Microlunatus sp.]
MNLDHYVESVRDGVNTAAALADDQTRSIAARLGDTIDASTRLALIEALSDAAGVISAELAPGSVDLRMAGHEPQFVVTIPPSGGEPTLLIPEHRTAAAESDIETPADTDDEPLARISLRLPASVKARVEELADEDGISTNAWLVRAITNAIERPREAPLPPTPPRPPEFGGFFGLNGPFGPHGVFGAGGPFAERTTRGHRERREDLRTTARGEGWKSAHGVQGWVR